ncbi:MAG: hypothetical protein CMN31_09595 [Sandaracinus sp.]|nr:hypothetical protein [Sandaracinus sp.]
MSGASSSSCSRISVRRSSQGPLLFHTFSVATRSRSTFAASSLMSRASSNSSSSRLPWRLRAALSRPPAPPTPRLLEKAASRRGRSCDGPSRMALSALRDAWDVLRHARDLLALLGAFAPPFRRDHVLNAGPLPEERDPQALLRALRDARHALKAELVDASGRVDYRRLRRSEAFAELERLAPGLRRLTPADLPSDAERISFFANLYNVLAIHGVLALGIERSVMEVPSFFAAVRYRVGEAELSLDAIENALLRCDAPHPATGRRVLPPGHAGHAFAARRLDPRVHAALVCASESCPPVGFYTPEQLDGQLELAARSWVNASVRVERGRLVLPRILRWYARDFGGRAGVAAFLEAHAEPPVAAPLRAALARGSRWTYAPYDWSLNAA